MAADRAEKEKRGSVLARFARAIMLRCPRCGSRGVLANWFRLVERCPTCELKFDRGEREDYWLGAYVINMVVALAATVKVAVLFLLWYWPESGPALWAGAICVVVTPIFFFPFSRMLWLAWDLGFRPEVDGE
jgi:uncharacterized protein (DUF983 family)